MGARGATAVALLVAVLAAGCASSYAGLHPEEEIPRCARWLAEGRAIPSTVVREPVRDASGRPFAIEMEERGSGDRDRLLVLVHGALSDRRIWRFMVGRLGAEHDLLLVDLPGCGGSDRPDAGSLGPRGYDPDALASVVLDAIEARLREQGRSPAVTLVGHSVGSTVVLRALGNPHLRREHAAVLDRVDGAVLLSPPDGSYAKRDPVFEGIANLSALEVFLGNLLGMVRGRIADSVVNSVEDPAAFPREEVDRFAEILGDPERRAAARSMLRNAVPFTADLFPDWERIEELERDLARVRVPCLVVAGGRDDAVPKALSFKICRQLPDARLRVLARTGHSLPTERPVECAGLILDFAATGGAGWVAYDESIPGSPDPSSLAQALPKGK